jgi:hypothetical protein
MGIDLRFWGCLFLVCIWGISSYAAIVGGEELDLFAVGFSASDLSLAEATVAQIGNPFGGFYNPATLPYTDHPSLYSFQGKLGDQVDLFALTSLFSLWDQPVSLTWVQLQAGNIPLVASENVGTNTDIDPDSFAQYGAQGVVAATSFALSREWRLGVSVMAYVKSLSSVSSAQAYGYSLTPGISGVLSPNWTFGMYFRGLVSQERWATAHSSQFLPEWHTGISYHYAFLSLLGEWISLPKSGYSGYGRVGAQIALGDTVFLRGGYQESHVNAGLGLHVGPVSVDYVFVGSSAVRFGESSRFSIGVSL